MRRKILAQRTVFAHAIHLLVQMFKPSKKLKKMSAILDVNPKIVAAVRADLSEASADWGSHSMSAGTGSSLCCPEAIQTVFTSRTMGTSKRRCILPLVYPIPFWPHTPLHTASSGLITQYQVFRGNPNYVNMIPDILTIHQKQYGHAPNKLCGDRRFYSLDNDQLASLIERSYELCDS